MKVISVDVLNLALRDAGIDHAPRRITNLSGGGVTRVVRIELDSHSPVVAKMTSASDGIRLEMEAMCLASLDATKTLLVPRVLAIGVFGEHAVLLMTHVDADQPTLKSWTEFGTELASLHLHPAGQQYGFSHNNYIGSTRQINNWMDDWVEFITEHRLGVQLRLARDDGLLTSDESSCIRRIIDRLDRFIPRRPRPSLLHGDLWSGNALPSVQNRIVVIDPACSVGDGIADLAMMQLFGGFPRQVYEAYFAAVGNCDQLDSRIVVYQLYHLLNHVNIFGRGYVGQAMSVAHRLV